MAANARIHTHTIDDLLNIQSLDLCIGIQLVEIAHAHRQVSVGKQLDCFSLGRMGNQSLDVLVFGTFFQQLSKHLRFLLLVFVGTHHNTARMQVVIQGFTLAQKLWREDDVVHTVFLAH